MFGGVRSCVGAFVCVFVSVFLSVFVCMCSSNYISELEVLNGFI